MNVFVRWSNATALAAAAVVLLVLLASSGDWVPGLLAAAVLLVAAWLVSPLKGRNNPTWSDIQNTDSATVVIFWRPGCVFCLRMRAALGPRARKAVWLNIWSDASAAAFVREHNGGNETVPTVILGGAVLTNPEPGVVRRELAGSRGPRQTRGRDREVGEE